MIQVKTELMHTEVFSWITSLIWFTLLHKCQCEKIDKDESNNAI